MEFVAATNKTHKLKEMPDSCQRMGHTVLSQKKRAYPLILRKTGLLFQRKCMHQSSGLYLKHVKNRRWRMTRACALRH